MTNKTEDKFYFGKPGEPESRKINDDLRRASVHISARNREGIEILETLWDAKNLGELSAGQESYLVKLTKEARDIGWRPVGSKFSRPGTKAMMGQLGKTIHLETLHNDRNGRIAKIEKRTSPHKVPPEFKGAYEYVVTYFANNNEKQSVYPHANYLATKEQAKALAVKWIQGKGPHTYEPVNAKFELSKNHKIAVDDECYFGKPGQPERFAARDHADIARALDNMIAKALENNLADIPAVVNARRVRNNRSATFGEKAQAWSDLKRELQNRSLMSRPGQPERFGLEDACWEGYEPIGTKQKDGRTVPNCVPKAKNAADTDEFASDDDRANDFLRKMAVGVTPSNLQQMQILVSQAMAYGQSKRNQQVIDEAKALREEIVSLKKAGH